MNYPYNYYDVFKEVNNSIQYPYVIMGINNLAEFQWTPTSYVGAYILHGTSSNVDACLLPNEEMHNVPMDWLDQLFLF
jgi:hypothetical protein